MKWTEWNSRGLIPGPQESEVVFLSRVTAADSNNRAYLERTRNLFDVAPDWVDVIESNRGLAPWHGAVTIIEDGKAALQIRARAPRWYDREELLAHELAHVGRCAFQEGKFEEFFAYRTSKSRLRRWLGPVIARPWEVWPLFGALLIGSWLPAIPLAVIALGLGRLGWRHITLNRCVRHLEQRLNSRRRAWAVAYRLTDREIRRAAKGHLRGDNSMRWRMLNAVYGLGY